MSPNARPASAASASGHAGARLRAAALAFCTLLPALLLAPAAAGPDTGGSALAGQQTGALGATPLVDEVTFRGVESLDQDELREVIATRPVRCRTFLLRPFCWVFEGAFFQERNRLDRDELPSDELRVRVFHWLRGYRDTEASTSVLPSGERVEVVFEVEEGPPTLLRSVEVVQEDSAVLSDDDIAGVGLPSEGEPLDMIGLEAAKEELREMLWNGGYANALIEDSIAVSVPDDPSVARQADVVLRTRSGRRTTIERIVIRGNEDVSDETIFRSLGLEPGELYRRRDLEEAQRRLYRSNLFRQSLVTTEREASGLTPLFGEDAPDTDPSIVREAPAGEPDPAPGDSTRVVVVVVREAPFDEVGAGIGFSTVQFGEVRGRYARHNFLGGGRRAGVRVAVGNLLAPQLFGRTMFGGAAPRGVDRDVEPRFLDPTWNVSAEFTQPWIRSHRNSFSLELFARRRAVPGVVVDRGFGGTATFTRRLGRELPASLTYRFEQTRVDAGGVYFCVNFGICESRTVGVLGDFHRLSPLRLTIRAERVDDPMEPHSGYTASLQADHASALTLSDYRYNAASAEGVVYRRLGPGVLVGRAMAGWVRALDGTEEALGIERTETEVLHPRNRVYSGGARSVRGYGESQLGPRILTVAAQALLETDPETGEPWCTEASIEDGTCDPAPLPTGSFQPRPLGGNQVVEGTVEYRFPLVGDLGGTVFLDAGHVGDLDLNIPTGARTAVTPGFGLRYRSPIGMIRVDLGIRPTLSERLPVITALGEAGNRRLLQLESLREYDPTGGEGGLFQQMYRRLVLHLSIGEPF